MPIANVLQKPIYHRRGNHVGHPLSDIAAVTLKGDADHLGVLHHRTTAVAWVDLRADLDRQMLVNRRMRVELKINSRHDPGCDRHPFTADWITIRRNGGFKR